MLAHELHLIDDAWRHGLQPKRGSALGLIVADLLGQPVITAQRDGAVGSVNSTTIYHNIDRLLDDGVLTEITEHRRNRVFVAAEVTAALDEFARVLGRRQGGR